MVEPELESSNTSQKSTYRTPPNDRRCSHEYEDGRRCRAYRARGHELRAGHAGLGFGGGKDAYRRAQAKSAERKRQLSEKAQVMAYGGVRAALLRAIEARTDTIIAAYDRGLASADDRVAMTAADTLLDRYLGRPTAVTESQPPGTQAYVECAAPSTCSRPRRDWTTCAKPAWLQRLRPTPPTPCSESDAVDPTPHRVRWSRERGRTKGREEAARLEGDGAPRLRSSDESRRIAQRLRTSPAEVRHRADLTSA